MELELVKIFVKVVQNGSFSKAALGLKLPKSTVSKAVSRLEQTTGTTLLVRTTRSLSVTAAGRAFYDACVGPIMQLEDAQKSLHGQDSVFTGLVRITAPEDLGEFVVAPAIAELTAQHPRLQFELYYTDTVVDLVKDGFDFAVRIGALAESSFKVKRAGEVVLVMVASPAYLKGKPKIETPKDLQEHACLTIGSQGRSRKWTLRSGRKTLQIPVTPIVISNQMTSILRMAIAGGGVALVPHYLCEPHFASRELVRILPEWASPGLPVSIVSPLSTSTSARLKLTIDHVLAALAGVLRN